MRSVKSRVQVYILLSLDDLDDTPICCWLNHGELISLLHQTILNPYHSLFGLFIDLFYYFKLQNHEKHKLHIIISVSGPPTRSKNVTGLMIAFSAYLNIAMEIHGVPCDICKIVDFV